MAFTQEQLTGLSAAYTRKQQGTANDADAKNIDYAISQGWKAPANVAPTPAPLVPTDTPAPVAPAPATVPAATAPVAPATAPAPVAPAPVAPPVAPTAPVQQPATNIPFIQGLSAEQQQSINNLVASGRQFNTTDLANWNFATNNAPVPNASGSNQQPINSTDATGSQNIQPSDQTDQGLGDFNFDNTDFSNAGDFSTDPSTTELLAKYGITPPSASGNPVQDYASTYNQLLTSMGLTDIKTEFNKVQGEYKALQNELNDKISAINDDPWASEGVRVGQIKSMQSKYEGKLQILTDQQKLYDSLYQQGVQQAQHVANATIQQQQFNSQQAFNVAELALKEQEARASLKSSNLRDQLAVAQEMRMQLSSKETSEEKLIDNARMSLKNIADIFGADVFMNMSASEKRKWERDAGLPDGTLDNEVTKDGSNGGLTSGQIQSTINQITGAFDNEPIVKNFNILGEAKQFVNNLGNNTNPSSTDDQGLIYAFAKAMDPNSAVKEGEYLTVQKYSQSLVQKGWADAKRILSNEAFLTPEARKNMIATIESKFSASKQGFDNLYNEYNRKIEDAKSGNIGGSIPNYGQAWEVQPVTLPALNKSYSSLDALIRQYPDYQAYVIDQASKGKDEATILRSLNSGQPVTFNSGMGGTPTAQNIGSLSARYESSGNPAAIGYDSTGGLSYGTYQLAHNNAQTFVNQSQYAKDFQGIKFNSQAWQNKWKEVAKRDPQGFEQAQHDFISKTHFQPQEQKLASAGINMSSLPPILKDVIWSTAVQHGANNNIVVNAFKSLAKNAPVADIIKKVYQLRWAGGANFASSTPAVQKSVYNRFFGKDGELATALKNINIG